MSQNIDLKEVKRFEDLELMARQLVEGFITGLHKSPYHGFSVEFAEHRLYNIGESTRHIDWKVYARSDKLFTKQYEEETNLRCQLLLDNSASMYYPKETKSKLLYAVYCAAAIAYLLQSQRDAVGLTIFNDKIEYSGPIKSTPGHLNKILTVLQGLSNSMPPQAKFTDTARIIHEIAGTNHKRSLIIVFSDMLDNSSNTSEIYKALQHLKHNKHEVLLFHIAEHSTELDFDFEERPHQFIDLETGEKLNLTPSQIKEQYQTKMKSFLDEVKLKCNQFKIDFIPVNTDTPINQILQSYLIKRARMR